jgi:hypothetical protein
MTTTVPFNLSLPAILVPWTFSADGAPIALQTSASAARLARVSFAARNSSPLEIRPSSASKMRCRPDLFVNGLIFAFTP